MVALGRTHPEHPVAISRNAIDFDGNSTSHQDTGWPCLLQTYCMALRLGSLVPQTTINALSRTPVNWNKPVIFDEEVFRKTFQWSKKLVLHFKAQIWLVLNLRHWTSEGSQLVGCSSTEREQSRNKLTLAPSSYLRCWEHIHSDHLKIHRMVKLEGRAVSPGWTVSTSSRTVGTVAVWQLLATISPGLQTTTTAVHWGWPKDWSM